MRSSDNALFNAGCKIFYAFHVIYRSRPLAWGLVLAMALAGGEASAALFSSIATIPSPGSTTATILTRLYRSDNNDQLGPVTLSGIVNAGATDVSITVDTTADKVRYDDVDFIAASLTPQVRESGSRFASYQILVAPADFPLPAVYQNVAGDYLTRVTYSSLATSGAPTLVSSDTDPIVPKLSVFTAAADVVLALPSITISGVYEAVGPLTTVSAPFSVVFNATATSKAISTIPGGPGFGDGFDFHPDSLQVRYVPTNPLVFDQVVDGTRFVGNIGSLNVDYFTTGLVPEPSSLGLLMAAAVSGAAALRRRRPAISR